MLMIGVSTEQNSSNLVPAIQLGISSFMPIETSRANGEGWSTGLIQVMQSHSIRVTEPVILKSDQDSRIDEIIRVVRQRLPTSEPVIWCLGGGQKPQQLACWQLFLGRNQAGIPDRACYANPVNQQLETWLIFRNEPKLETTTLSVNLTAEEILTAFNYRLLKTDKSVSIYPVSGLDPVTDFYSNSEFRGWMKAVYSQLPSSTDISLNEFRTLLEKRKPEIRKKVTDFIQLFKKEIGTPKELNAVFREMETSIPGKLGNWLTSSFIRDMITDGSSPDFTVTDPELTRFFGRNQVSVSMEEFERLTGMRRPSDYFERSVLNSFQSLIQQEKPSKLSEAIANVEITPVSGKLPSNAEIDLLIVTTSGQLLSVDAKSYSFDKKDADARIYNLQKAGGRFGKLIAVIPFYFADLDSDAMDRQIQLLPNDLQMKNIPFYAMTDSQEPVTLWMTGSKGITREESPGFPQVQIRPLNSFFRSERLI